MKACVINLGCKVNAYESEYIKEILVYGKEIEGELEPRVAAVVFPDFDNIKREFGEEISTEEIHKLIGTEIKKYNKLMPTYKYVKENLAGSVEKLAQEVIKCFPALWFALAQPITAKLSLSVPPDVK